MNKFENLKPGTRFTVLGVEYEMVRYAGEIEMPNRNQWGRREGGKHKAHRVVVKVNRHHRGWSAPHYTGFAHFYTPVVLDSPSA